MSAWFDAHPEIATFRVAVADLNGQPRGKRLPRARVEKILKDGVRMPLSALNLDVTGEDIDGSPLVFASGDADGVARPTGRGPLVMPWVTAPSALIPLWLYQDDGRAFSGDPRHALAAILARYKRRGLEPIVATELEFYLMENGAPPLGQDQAEILSLRTLDAYDAFFTELYAGAAAMQLGADAAISEGGPGQFEVNLEHTSAMRAADNAWLFKLLVMGLAPRFGLSASFMAKPYPEAAGTGLHVHFSLLDQSGTNVFDDGSLTGSPTLGHAIAGCLQAMGPSTLLFAPHGPSYDRFVDEAHAPTAISWGHENRTAAIRVPGGAPYARRIEHRVAGGDANPYLLLAAILGAALAGIEDQAQPPAPITGNAYAANLERIPTDWRTAIDRFATASEISRILPADLIRNFTLTKEQEIERTKTLGGEARHRLYAALV